MTLKIVGKTPDKANRTKTIWRHYASIWRQEKLSRALRMVSLLRFVHFRKPSKGLSIFPTTGPSRAPVQIAGARSCLGFDRIEKGSPPSWPKGSLPVARKGGF